MNMKGDIEVAVDMSAILAHEAAEDLADMMLLTKHILATRHVTELHVELSHHYSLREVAATLGPLVPRIKVAVFFRFKFVPIEWRDIEVLLHSVRILRFYNCKLTAEVLALFAGYAELQGLCLVDCHLMGEWVVDMAAVRSVPSP